MPQTIQFLVRALMSILQFVVLLTAYASLLYIGTILLSTVFETDKVDSKRQTKLALYSGVVGSIAFALVNPFVTPLIYDTQESLGMAPQPTPDIELKNKQLSQSNHQLYGVEYQEDRRVYVVKITNLGRKKISDMILRFGFHGCNIESGFAPVPYEDSSVMDDLSKVEFRPPRPAEEVERCYEDVRVSELSTDEDIKLFFVTDQQPNTSIKIGDSVGIDPGQTYIEYEFDWTFHGREYQEEDSIILSKKE